MNALVPRQTVEQVCAFRDEAVRHFEIAFGKIAEASAAVSQANQLWEAAAPGKPGLWSSSTDEIKRFFDAVRLPDRDQYLRVARRLIDVSVWTHVIEVAGIEQLMDNQAKNELRDQMKYVPERTNHRQEIINQDEIDKMLPPVTPENVYATLERFQADAELIWRRGIVNAFSKLDRRFRSHDGFKVGSRIILNYFLDSSGSLYSSNGKAEILTDIERTFLVLDGKSARASYAGIVAQIHRENPNTYSRRNQFEVAGDYFRVVVYKNGNAHLWFTRKDLVQQVNKILADHYGEVIGDGMAKEADPLQEKKLTPAKHFGFYPTPDDTAERMLSEFNLLQPADQPRMRVLEPSAGTGNLARRCISRISVLDEWSGGRERYRHEYRFDNQVDCVELQPHLAHQLEAEGIYGRVYCQDFLQITPAVTGLYDRIVMNPPFDRERDIDHVTHALDFLKPGGQLVAIMSAGTEFRETRKAVAFRDLMQKMRAKWRDLPPGSFASVGTYVNTLTLTVRKPLP